MTYSMNVLNALTFYQYLLVLTVETILLIPGTSRNDRYLNAVTASRGIFYFISFVFQHGNNCHD